MEVYPSSAEGIGLENRQGSQIPRGFESLYLLHFQKSSKANQQYIQKLDANRFIFTVAGWSSPVARRAHNPKVAGSNPVPAIIRSRGVAVNMPACHAGDRGFDSRRDRHFLKKSSNMWLSSSVGRAKD